MRSLIAIATLFAASLTNAQDLGTAAPPPTAAKLAAIEDMLSVLKLEKQQEQAILQIRTAFTQQIQSEVASKGVEDSPKFKAEFQKFQDKLFDLIFSRMSWPKIKPEYIKLYDETFTVDELKGITAFYRTPAGQAFVDKLPVVTQKAIALGQRLVAGAGPEIERLTDEFMESLKKQ